MTDKIYPKSNLPIRKSVELLPTIFQTSANDKFLSGVLDPLVQPGVLEKVVGYIGRKYGKTYVEPDIYVDDDNTLRSRYQLEPGVVYKNNETVENFYDYLDFKNQLKFFGNTEEQDNKTTDQTHYSWNPPITWDKFVNYREYYWIPSGPWAVQILGQSAKVTSTYKVSLGETNNSYVFTPDAYTNNPTITLYRGQTYKFRINAPNEKFYIKTNYDSGSLIFVPNKTYLLGSLVVYDGKLWRALTDVSSFEISVGDREWEYIEPSSKGDALIYNNGVTNNGIENGTLTFTVPYDAPDILFYQSSTTPDCSGRFLISDIESNTYINVDKDVIGKSTYTSSNGVEFTNGLVVEFTGTVLPQIYSADTWLVEGVGEAITLTRFNDLIVPVLTAEVPEVLFDNEGFDTQPFDDASAYPTFKDYITISRDSIDRNPWSRYNRWFHRSVLDYAYSIRGQDFPAPESARAKRPIIEFKANIQLFNFGSVAKQTVDYIDTFTIDVLSTIEGSTGYNVDGEFLFEGARVLVVADLDPLTNNKIYEVTFIIHNGRRRIHLKETTDSYSVTGETALIRRGTTNGGKMFYYTGSSWIESQAKTSVNQPPLFDAFDNNGISFSNPDTYPSTTFTGTPLLSYLKGNGRIDTELGFSLSYLNINNVGDIQFKWNWDTETFSYVVDRASNSKLISTGTYKFNPNNTIDNGWLEINNKYIQPIIDSQIITNPTNSISFKSIIWNELTTEPTINFYINSIKYAGSWTRNLGDFIFPSAFAVNDIVSIKIIADATPDQGYYEIPVGLEINPLNSNLETFTLGQAVDHVSTALEFNSDISGIVPGNSNLRDISNYQQYAKRFLKHSGIVPVAMMTLCDKTHNIIKAIQYSSKSYVDFKNNFLIKAVEIDFNTNLVDFVDDIVNSLSKTKTEASPFASSDLIGAGAYTAITYVVEDTGITTFSLSEKFDLKLLSTRAVYVYLNNIQLLNSRDYEFDSIFGFVKIFSNLIEGDSIEIREYISTATNFIPPTPTSMGLYKKYTPMKFIDDTYQEPKEVIQGHDGSITPAYGDFRDDLLLELEYRIYNNIKQEYDSAIFDIDSIIGGYNGVGLYTKSQLDDIVSQGFLKWIQNTNINYTINEYFDSENSFTYTYSNMTDPTQTQNLPGYWRGVYQWFYDTDRPHRCPWEMLGFSEQPAWWQAQYGAAPYTRGNLLLWEDLRDGIIRQGPRAGTYDRYKRPTILSHIPTDGDGKLLSPLDSGLAQNFSLINNRGSFVLGDIAPTEYGWRSTSDWPFAVTLAMCLMKPFEFITDNFDTSRLILNELNQTVAEGSKKFVTIKDIVSHASSSVLSTGLVNYLISYTKSRGLPVDTLWNKITNLDVALSYRMSGFVDQQQQKFLLDSKSPSSTSSNIYVPQENYNVIFNISSPISSITYSGVVLEKTEGGWIITGYDDIQPYFNFHQPLTNNKDPLITIGGLSETFVVWTENRNYSNGTIVRYGNDYFRAIKTHNSLGSFDTANWQKLLDLPKIGAISAYRRRNFNTISIKRLSYGTRLTSIQQVVDFLLGYESYLNSIGFIFDNYDPENKVSQDWLSSAKEFMFWTKHNWAIGSIISLSPSAQKININVPVGVSDNILDGFYDYQILKGDGKPLQPRFVDVNRMFQNVTVNTTNTTDGIYYLKLYYVLKEHVTIFDDRTVFNDIIYDKTTGYRQGRIKVQGFRTTDWDGDYTSPGFLFDNVSIQIWKPWTDYKLGDIVAYKSYNWTSLANQLGSETFSDTFWSRLDTTPTKQLISNFDYKIKGFSDFFEVASEGVSQSQRDLARHSIGYQSREYLQNLSADPVTQFQLYQGFIREKGTRNAVNKIFSKLSRAGTDSVTLNEEWAFLLGRFGGSDQTSEIEIQIEKNRFELEPQVFVIQNSIPSVKTNQNYVLTDADFTIPLVPYTADIVPVSLETEPTFTAGYISEDQYDHAIKSLSDLTTLDITTVNDNDHIWVTFYNDTWTVLRSNDSLSVQVIEVTRVDDTTVTVTLNRPHAIVENEYVGFRTILNLTGFYKVISVTNTAINVEIDSQAEDPSLDESSLAYVTLLLTCRFKDYQNIDEAASALYKNKSLLFVDNNGDNLWEVVEKNIQYIPKQLTDYGTFFPLYSGTKVVYDNNYKNIFSSIPGAGFINIYVESSTALALKQIISPPVGFYNIAVGSFGNSIAVSPDGLYLIVGAPEASGVNTPFKGDWLPNQFYTEGDIVLYSGQLWKARNSNPFQLDGSTILAINTDDWEKTTIIPTSASASSGGLFRQGMVAIYKQTNGRFELVSSFVSPRPANNELFGSAISIGMDGANYYIAISATGASNNTGRVYLLKGSGSSWAGISNPSYKGIYNPVTRYYAGDIVWQASQDPILEDVKGNLWQALEDQLGDGSTLSIDTTTWAKVSDISTDISLPTNIAVDDDGSTLAAGILSNTQMAELIKEGDQFGFSSAMNADGSILTIGAPYSDGQYFPNYRGIWRSDIEYIEGEVVKYQNTDTESYVYYKLDTAFDSADYRSSYDEPSSSVNWMQVSDSTTDPSGKVFVYKRTSYGSYVLTQMINSGSITDFTDISSNLVIASGDEFGYSMDLDANGSTLVISRPRADTTYNNQGSVYVLSLDATTTEYRVVQKLESYEIYPDEYFGHGVSISPDGEKITVGAKNTPTTLLAQFDIISGTYFDNGRTTFSRNQGYTGSVYVFDKKDQTFFLTEKLISELQANEGFGSSVDCIGSVVLVGSPYYKSSTGDTAGTVRLFRKDDTASSWNVVEHQSKVIDIRKVRSIELYDNINNVKIQDIDYIDPAKGKILNIADQEIQFKTPYDPAVYTIGIETVVVDSAINWLEKNVGKLWWNISDVKWIYSEQGDIAYRKGNWNQSAFGSVINVYEWVETALLPSEWAALADTNEGLAVGISGQPLYPNDNVYSVKQFYNSISGIVSETLYYYWVKNKTVPPVNVNGRLKSAAEVTTLISNPANADIAFVAFIDTNKFIAYNFKSVMASDTALLNIEFKNNLDRLNPVHLEYQLLTEGVADSLPTEKLKNKWIDSLVGTNIIGNRVPDTSLSAKQKYGVSYRPRQGMFVDRVTALKTVVDNVNTILMKEAFATKIEFTNLNLVDTSPLPILNLYDDSVDTEIDLATVGVVRTKQALLKANIVNGTLDTIDILDPGFGYKVVPDVILNGTGTGAKAEITLDNQGRVITVTVISPGKNYSALSASVRYFSILVRNDSTIGNFWSIYSWDNDRKIFFRNQSQSYDTTKYWDYADWWKEGYSNASRITTEFTSLYEELTSNSILLGDLIRIKEYGAGGWAVFEKMSNTGNTFLDRFFIVGQKNGTIQLNSAIYNSTVYGTGFDNTQAYDDANYDLDNSKELRNIFAAIEQDIFIGDYSVEWNKLFFTSMRYILAEQQYVDWMFKTSFLNATHNVGSFVQTANYKNDNLDSYREYIDEVKPYRTTVREYVSRYDNTEMYASSSTDFDLPPTYSLIDGKVVPIQEFRPELSVYPWKWWSDNNGYSIVDIRIYNSGTGYRAPPTVLITGNGTGAKAQAYISNGVVSGIVVLDGGTGYTTAPEISLVGGNSSGDTNAKASAILGNAKPRTFDLSIKFDRVSKIGTYQNYVFEEQLISDGRKSLFELKYPPTRDKSLISVYKNGQVLLLNDYSITLYYANNQLRGKLLFLEAPVSTDNITINYEKNIELLDAVNRIDKFYNPTSGMAGKELNQLMTGVDFGGVQIQGTTFDVTGGWDALPWFTDNWDSVESSADYYVVVDIPTNVAPSDYVITLPFTPTVGQQITVYLKKTYTRLFRNFDTLGTDTAPSVSLNEGTTGSITRRIDDPYFSAQDDSSTSPNPNAEMPTIVGDGITKIVEIGRYIHVENGDILIFRPIESDGSVTITDDNLLDTALSGGTLSNIDQLYITATGRSAEEIVIDGSKFISPDQVPAPEENIPGQVLDSVSIRVFHNTISGAAPLQSKISTSDGVTTVYKIGQRIIENNSVLVYVNKIKQELNIDYTIDLENFNIEFINVPTVGDTIEILSIGIGGLGILDYQEFIADGTTNLFLTNANYNNTSSIFVTVNGEYIDTGFKNSTGVTEATEKTLVEFGFYPAVGSTIKIVCLKSSDDTDSSGVPVVKINTQTLYFEGSTRSFDLDNFVDLARGTARNSMIVELNGRVLKGSDTLYAVYNGTNNEFTLGQDPFETPGSILPSNIRVFINNVLATFITDYVFEGPSKILTIYSSVLDVGDIIKIQNDLKAEYSVVGNNLIIDDSIEMLTTNESNNDRIDVTWFSEYPSMDIISDQKSGGKVQYNLQRTPLSISYVWVYKNGVRLVQDTEYSLSLPRGVVYLNVTSTPDDDIKIISFTNDILRLPSAFEIHKDMLNIYHFNRFSKGTVTLAADLKYYDTTIEVNDGTLLSNPIANRNIPGIIYISGERIEYMAKSGNILSQLRRGIQGTAIGDLYTISTPVTNIGYEDIIPYTENQEKFDFYSDGSTLLVGPFDFTPSQGTRSTWYRNTIPNTYGPCDQIEVFTAGRRLRKDPIDVWVESKGAYSPDADDVLEAEFSVDGTSAYIRLTEPVPAGTRITVIKRVGKLWYDRGENTASAGISLIENDSPIAKFIAQKTTSLPE